MLKAREVFEVVPRPEERNMVGSKWVYAIKWKEDGGLERQKARTMAKGFTQVIGEDYEETYASIARLESVRLVCAIAASRRLHLWQIDFVSAFLNSNNSYEVFIEQPRGFEEGGDNHIWRLCKTLYGTMQGVHDWAENLNKTFEGHSFYKSRADPQICSRVYGDKLTLISIWTDDVLGVLSTIEGENLAKSQLGASYEIKDLGEAKLILEMRINRDPITGNISLSQKSYCERILKHFNMENCSPKLTPLPPGLLLTTEDCPNTPEEANEMKDTPYWEALGSLM